MGGGEDIVRRFCSMGVTGELLIVHGLSLMREKKPTGVVAKEIEEEGYSQLN